MRSLLILTFMAASPAFASGVQPLPALPNGATAQAVQVDSSGNLYVAGYTSSNHAFA